ncbi:putative damage-inducible protein DinB [Curtobacterium sp. PhB130]|uniref:DinB family protein n=1 Tax=unclassified Curtobacterium TaxID=257496 RepID=UPI000F4C2B2C|nr:MULTISPECIES: DinB family protein [unclassified Curtobacterium]ROS75720.1 putative damage-inducible protein DinB [Curtobacterium sp. PhB130]TCK64545.1 putative damage-inducible protein DinB [Curtobacterium sp. PhB136]
MVSAQDDIVELVEYASQRLADRMATLDDDEWAWEPIPGNAEVTIRWRLDHIAEMLGEERNWAWLGADVAGAPMLTPATSAAAALAAVELATDRFVELARGLGDAADEPIGAVAGPYGDSSKRSLVLHVVDELIHHAAEAALLRDLYLAQVTPAPR